MTICMNCGLRHHGERCTIPARTPPEDIDTLRAEAERLREDVNANCEVATQFKAERDAMADKLARHMDENPLTQVDADYIRQRLTEAAGEMATLRAEVQRLQAEQRREQTRQKTDRAEAWAQRDRAAAEVERLRGLLAEAPCTCPNPEPHDWPHDPNNENCYKTRIDAALRGGEGP